MGSVLNKCTNNLCEDEQAYLTRCPEFKVSARDEQLFARLERALGLNHFYFIEIAGVRLTFILNFLNL
jgi:hypothetical protein